MTDAGYLEERITESLKGTDLFLVDIIIKPGNRIYVFLDGDRDVTIEDCARVSRDIQGVLLSEPDHELIVSSCGADQPLKLPRQYNKHLGRSLTVTLEDGSILSGKLEKITIGSIMLHPEPEKHKKHRREEHSEAVQLLFENIVTAKVNISFNQK